MSVSCRWRSQGADLTGSSVRVRAAPVTLIRKDAPVQQGEREQRHPATAGRGELGFISISTYRGYETKKSWKEDEEEEEEGEAQAGWGFGGGVAQSMSVEQRQQDTRRSRSRRKRSAEVSICSLLRLPHAHNSECYYHFMFEEYSSMEAASPSQHIQYAYRAEPLFFAATINHPLLTVLCSVKPRL